MVSRYGLTDSQWAKIKDMRPGKAGDVGVTAKDNRLFVDAVLYRYRAGIPWRDLPARYGDFRVVHTRFSRWAKRGVWASLFSRLAGDADNEYAMMDSTLVRAHQHSAGAQKKPEKTRPSVAARAASAPKSMRSRMPWATRWPSCRQAAKPATSTVPTFCCVVLKPTRCWRTGRGYDADERVILPLQAAGKTVVLPSKKNRLVKRDYDRDLYKARHLIENFFAKLKPFRAIATRYDKTARNFLAAIHFAAAFIWLN